MYNAPYKAKLDVTQNYRPVKKEQALKYVKNP